MVFGGLKLFPTERNAQAAVSVSLRHAKRAPVSVPSARAHNPDPAGPERSPAFRSPYRA